MTKKEKILFYIEKKAIKRQFIADFLNISKQNLAYHFNKKNDITLEFFHQILKSLEIDEVKLNYFIERFDESKRVKEPESGYKSNKKDAEIIRLEKQIEILSDTIDMFHSRFKDLENENTELKLIIAKNNSNKLKVKK